MYKKIRKSVAEIFSNVENPEQFQWNKWIKEPQIFLERFPKPRVEINKVENFDTFVYPSLYQVKKFTLTKFKISAEIGNVIIKRKKTFKVFFNFSKPYQRKIQIFDSTVGKVNFELLVLEKDKKLFFRTNKNNLETITYLVPDCLTKTIESFNSTVEKISKHEIKNVKQHKYELLLNKFPPSENKLLQLKPLPANKLSRYENVNSKLTSKRYPIDFVKLEKKPPTQKFEVVRLDELKIQMRNSTEKKVLLFTPKTFESAPEPLVIDFVKLNENKLPTKIFETTIAPKGKTKLMRFEKVDKIDFNLKNYFRDIITITRVSNPGILSDLTINSPSTNIKKSKKIKFKKESPAITRENKQAKKELNLEQIEASICHLKNYQKEAIRSFLNNKTTLLCDALGLDSKFQVSHALNLAMEQEAIKTALIVCPDSHIGDKNLNQHISNSEGWENHLLSLNSGLPTFTFRNIDELKNAILLEDKQIYLTNYKTLQQLISDPAKKDLCKKIDCLVLDEAQHLLTDELDVEKLYNFPISQYHWVLSSQPQQIIEESLIPKLKNHIIGFEKINIQLNRTFESYSNELPKIIRQDYWLENDHEQKQELENTILQGQGRISELVKGGNPFIIQSNIFTLIHQIKQVGNFSTHKNTSPKSDLLLDQIESIIASGQRCIIFSQYDRQGIQKIEQLLSNNQIRYVPFQSGMALKDMEESISLFQKDSKIRVMLACITASNMKIKIPQSPYIIYFDQWWNPVTQWQLEDKSLSSDSINSDYDTICSINYFNINPIELKIRSTLEKRGLLVKNLIEFLSNESIYSLFTNEDWFEILGVEFKTSIKNQRQDPEDILNTLKESSLTENGHRVKEFFSKLGYKNLNLKLDSDSKTIVIYGSVQKALTEIKSAVLYIPFNLNDPELIINFIKEASKHNNRLFIICSEELLNQIKDEKHDRIVYIGEQMLANYFSIFNIY